MPLASRHRTSFQMVLPGAGMDIFQDESRVRQRSQLSRIWTKKIARPQSMQDQHYGNCYLVSSIFPDSGCIVHHVCDKANTEQVNLHLQQICAKPPKWVHKVIVLDSANWHTSKKLKVPDHSWLLHLPPYSPQLNPAEILFQNHKKNFIANHGFETTDILLEAVLDGLNKFVKSTDRIKSISKNSWATLTIQNETSDERKTCSSG